MLVYIIIVIIVFVIIYGAVHVLTYMFVIRVYIGRSVLGRYYRRYFKHVYKVDRYIGTS